MDRALAKLNLFYYGDSLKYNPPTNLLSPLNGRFDNNEIYDEMEIYHENEINCEIDKVGIDHKNETDHENISKKNINY
nr:8135_t:CDS:2 [Entrophospora candida]